MDIGYIIRSSATGGLMGAVYGIISNRTQSENVKNKRILTDVLQRDVDELETQTIYSLATMKLFFDVDECSDYKDFLEHFICLTKIYAESKSTNDNVYALLIFRFQKNLKYIKSLLDRLKSNIKKARSDLLFDFDEAVMNVYVHSSDLEHNILLNSPVL